MSRTLLKNSYQCYIGTILNKLLSTNVVRVIIDQLIQSYVSIARLNDIA